MMKIANWNIEWMNRWFNSDSDPVALKTPEQAQNVGISDLPDLMRRVGQVIENIQADVIAIQEGPSRREEMQLFVNQALQGQYDIYGPSGMGQQKLYVLVRQQGTVSSVGFPPPPEQIDLGATWDVDVDGDMWLDPYEFTRDPLLVDITSNQGNTIRLINLHTKSKYVHGGQQLWNSDRQAFIVKALKARRRISAEVMRVREYIESMLDRDPEARIVVVGDLNDGEGTDFFERHYLTHNLVGMIAGSPFHPRRMLRHAFIDTMPKEFNYTAVFDDYIDNIQNRQILLDHILVSPALYWLDQNTPAITGLIEHQAFESEIDVNTSGRQQLPSDHRPQSVTLPI
ncbi:MAG: endonuclease/exonuclease/phosphatase family protein [Bacteroidota bacterium]